ncbi:MAG: AtpZ/AtpI family protein [Oscillospiraceae bacterium]|nr:AtpZ/AtpI family protein [Oscillospiraceae bacterium]
MKDLSLLTWLTQLGLSVALPPVALILLAVWLRNRFGWGNWILWVGIILGIYCGVTGFISSMRTLSRLTKEKRQDKPVVSFNEHD